ncbi:MAG: transposase [Firmicutes bacterium]|nr:transposase [Bacillota bacterium]
MKAQVIADKKSGIIICTSFANGKKHDFRIFKESKTGINEKIRVGADTGFQGIHKVHKNSEIPKKKTKKHPLTKQEKKNNHEISSKRVKIENIIGFVKRFNVLSVKYRFVENVLDYDLI